MGSSRYSNAGRPFYKYYSAQTAITHVLDGNTIKWATPFDFNDPFDNQLILSMEEFSDGLVDALYEKFFNSNIWDNFEVRAKESSTLLITGTQMRQLLSSVEFTEREKTELKESIVEGIKKFDNVFPNFQSNFEAQMRDTLIFCISETYDNLLMWSHYADKHTGLVVQFRALEEVDSPLLLAKPVNYTSNMPILRYQDFYTVDAKDIDFQVRKLVNVYTLTKSTDWEYEREWRVITRNRQNQVTSQVLPYAPEELGAVYLGCKMVPEDREQVISILGKKYPHAEIYQAFKSKNFFSLEFERIR